MWFSTGALLLTSLLLPVQENVANGPKVGAPIAIIDVDGACFHCAIT